MPSIPCLLPFFLCIIFVSSNTCDFNEVSSGTFTLNEDCSLTESVDITGTLTLSGADCTSDCFNEFAHSCHIQTSIQQGTVSLGYTQCRANLDSGSLSNCQPKCVDTVAMTSLKTCKPSCSNEFVNHCMPRQTTALGNIDLAYDKCRSQIGVDMPNCDSFDVLCMDSEAMARTRTSHSFRNDPPLMYSRHRIRATNSGNAQGRHFHLDTTNAKLVVSNVEFVNGKVLGTGGPGYGNSIGDAAKQGGTIRVGSGRIEATSCVFGGCDTGSGAVVTFPTFDRASSGILDTTKWNDERYEGENEWGYAGDWTFEAFVTPTTIDKGTILSRSKSGEINQLGMNQKGWMLSLREDGYVELFIADAHGPTGYTAANTVPACVTNTTTYPYTSGEYNRKLTSATPLLINQRSHIVFVKRSRAFELYVDGTLSCQVHFTSEWVEAPYMGGTGGGLVVLGAHYESTGTSPTMTTFPGKIELAKIYEEAFSAQQLSEDTMCAYWGGE